MTDNIPNMEMDEFDNVVVMEDEDGNEVSFEFADFIEFENRDYVVLLPLESEDLPSDEVVILEVISEDEEAEEMTYAGVADRRILNAVFELFKQRNADNFDFTE